VATSCWKGVREIALPLLHDNVHVATLFVGVWRRVRAQPQLSGVPHHAAVQATWQHLRPWETTAGEALTAHRQWHPPFRRQVYWGRLGNDLCRQKRSRAAEQHGLKKNHHVVHTNLLPFVFALFPTMSAFG